MTKGEAKRLRSVIITAVSKEDDNVALENPNLLPEWEPDKIFEAGRKIVYFGVVYKVLQTHTSQISWPPDMAPSLFARVLIPDEDVIPDWEQPDSTNPYMTGDKVRYNGVVYESLIDNNIWSPEAYPAGWRVVE